MSDMSRFVSETGRYAWGIGTRGDGQRGGFRSGSYRSGSYRSGSNRPGSNRPGSYINVMDNSRPLALNDYPKGPTLAEWGSSELMPEEDGNSENLTKTNYELLASYNWLPLDRKEGEAAMVVPGKYRIYICILNSDRCGVNIINMVPFSTCQDFRRDGLHPHSLRGSIQIPVYTS